MFGVSRSESVARYVLGNGLMSSFDPRRPAPALVPVVPAVREDVSLYDTLPDSRTYKTRLQNLIEEVILQPRDLRVERLPADRDD